MTKPGDPAERPGHAAERELRALAAGTLTAEDLGRDLAVHIESCATCRAEVELRRCLAGLLADVPAGRCPEPEMLIRLADRMPLPAEDETALEGHLTACLSCASKLEGLARADRRRYPPPPSAGSVRRAVTSLVGRLRSLVVFDMPESLALTTRQAAAAASASYQAGMTAYRRGRFADACRALQRAHDQGDRTRDLDFFLGACLLRAGQTAAAAEMFALAVRRSPRLGEYRWYLAQALLSEGRGADALRQLEKAAALPGHKRADARRLAGRVAALLAHPSDRPDEPDSDAPG